MVVKYVCFPCSVPEKGRDVVYVQCILHDVFFMFKANGWPPGRVSAMAARHNDESVKQNGSPQTGVHQHAKLAGESNPAPTNK